MRVRKRRRRDNGEVIAVASFTAQEWLGTLLHAHHDRFPGLNDATTYLFIPEINEETLVLTVEVSK